MFHWLFFMQRMSTFAFVCTVNGVFPVSGKEAEQRWLSLCYSWI